jgi:hypothetical protein
VGKFPTALAVSSNRPSPVLADALTARNPLRK